MEQLSEEKLIQQARHGDQDAICQLYENTKNYAWFIASRYLKNSEDIADALQETYISAFSKLHTFEDGKSFKTWIHTIVVNKCLDFLKKKRVMQISTGEVAELINEDEDIIPALWIERAEKRRDIIRIIDALPEGQRMAISLFYIEGLPISEIAAIMSVTEGSVKTHLSRGRKAIKEAVLLEEKKGNKLYGIVAVPLLTQLFELEAEAAVMPEEMSKIVWEGTLRGLAAAEGPGTSGQNVHNSGTGGAASATVKKSMTLATKIIIGVVAAAVLTAGAFIIPGLIGTPGPTQADFDRAVAENAALRERLAGITEQNEPDPEVASVENDSIPVAGYRFTNGRYENPMPGHMPDDGLGDFFTVENDEITGEFGQMFTYEVKDNIIHFTNVDTGMELAYSFWEKEENTYIIRGIQYVKSDGANVITKTSDSGDPVWIVEPTLGYNYVGYNHTIGFHATYEEYGEMYKINTKTGASESEIGPTGGSRL